MTLSRTEATALWRLLTVLAGWDEIVDGCEVDADLDLLLAGLPERLRGDLDADDVAQVRLTLDALIAGNLAWAEQANLRPVDNVPGCDRVGIT